MMREQLLRTSVLLILTGCGTSEGMTDYSALTLVPVIGRVTVDGQPISFATVIFEAEDGTWSSGRTDRSGFYRMQFNSETEGVTPGRKIVRIYDSGNRRVSDEDDSSDGSGDETTNNGAQESIPRLKVPRRYGRQLKLTAEVNANTRELNFDLRSEGGSSD